MSMATDVLKKVEGNLECHSEFVKNLENSKAWIENAREVIRECADTSAASKKEHLQANLDRIKVFLLHLISSFTSHEHSGLISN